MESSNLSKEELTNLIFYGLQENKLDILSVNHLKLQSILDDYYMFCNHFKVAYVIGELDTFKRAACLMVAINRGKLSHDKRLNASIAFDVAHKMCEKPYWNVGENYDIPKKLEEVNYKEVFVDNMDIYNTSKDMLVTSLIYENGVPLNYNLNLELFYQAAIMLKHKSKEPEKSKYRIFKKSLK